LNYSCKIFFSFKLKFYFILFYSYRYTGHGSGSQYFPSEDVEKLRVNACSILMGCSSGDQYTMGEFEPYGTILAYILAGCPSVVGNLWDVTDRDIDRFTEDFLKSWMNLDINEITNTTDNDDSSNICTHLIKARNACKLSHLNGSAPVIYGMPLSFE
jgi:separase